MANEIHIINEVSGGLGQLDKQLADINVKILSISKAMRSIPKQLFDAKTPKQVNEVIKERQQHTERINVALKEQDRVL